MAILDHGTRTSPARAAAVPAALVALVSAVLASVWVGLGVASLPGIALLVPIALGVVVLFTWSAPAWLVVLTPAALPLQVIASWLRFEGLFGILAFFALLYAIPRRPAWLSRMSALETAMLAMIAWAMCTGFWCEDPWLYYVGVRRLLFGWCTLWVAYRLPGLAPRRLFEVGLLACAAILAGSALIRRVTLGLSPHRLALDRAAATHLGWGTANYIATLLLILTPPLIVLALRSPRRALRTASWLTLGLIALMQFLIASRAATVLFIGGVIATFAVRRGRRRWPAVTAAIAAIAGLVISPLGTELLGRFTSPREIGSIVVRIWYFRDAWRRTLSGFPWGIGLGQGLRYPDHLADTDPHNYWLMLSSELGVLGVIAWIVVLAVLWRKLSQLATRGAFTAEGRALQIAFWLSQLHTLVEPTFQGQHYQFLYFWLMGGYLGYGARAAAQATANQPRPEPDGAPATAPPRAAPAASSSLR